MKSKIYSLLFLLFSFLTSMSQDRTVSGQVKKANGEAISGATVSIKGTKTATATNDEGRFTITIPNKANTVLVFSSVGYKPQQVTVGNQTAIDISLDEDASTLTDVVVIGYQSVQRKNLSSSVSSIGAKDLKDIPINSAAEALNGRLAGVTASTSEGSPDAQIRIRVRGGMSITGDNNPLFIIDGVQVENGLNTISPQDIQSIDVLKDAAATAIYGARGANGVIVITTKSGKPGRFIVAYNGYVGIKNLAKELKVLSPYDYVIFQSERSRGSGTSTPNDSTNFLANFGTTWDTLAKYQSIDAFDWQKAVFGNTALTTTQNISASGGNNKVTYNLGYTFNDEKAIVLNSRFQRHLFNAKADYKVTKNLKIGVSGRYNHQDIYGAGISSESGSSYSRLRNAVKYRPFLSKGLDINALDPLVDPSVGNNLFLINPFLSANAEYQKKSTDAYNGNATLSYNITKNLSFKSTFGYDENHLINRLFSDSLSSLSIIQGGRLPIAELDTTVAKTITNSNVLTWSVKNLGDKHSLDFLVGEETYDLRTETRNDLFKNYPYLTSADNAFKQTSLGIPFASYPKFNKSRYTNLSFFGRINYSYMDKYLFSANVREDGASKFAPGRQWGNFPAMSFAWRVKKENFLEGVNFISDLKLRAGFGTVGNNRINNYLYIPNFTLGTYYYGLNNQLVSAYSSSSLVNPDLQWESTVNRNYGIDLSLFNSRINISFDIYNNTSNHLLLNVPIASTYGYTTQIQNVGETSNKGVELQLNAAIIKTKDFSWSANFNISHNKNRIVALAPNQQQFFPGASWGVSGQPTDYIIKIGQPVGSMYGLITDGFYTTNDFNFTPGANGYGIYTLKPGIVSDAAIIGTVQPGSIKFKNLNGDSVIDFSNDRTIIGDPTPKFTGGLNQQFTYKNWDASIFVNFSIGNDIYNANKIEFTNAYSNNSNMLAIMAGRWKVVTETGATAQFVTSTGQVTGLPPDQLNAINANASIWIPIKSTGAFVPSSWAIEDGSFLRLNNVTIGYTLPVKSLTRIKMSKLRFYVTGNNLAIITNYTGYDPEVSVRNSPLTPGLDYSAYPKSRSFIFGINATF